MIFLELFLGFLKVGLFSFGGAYAAIPLIRDIVLSYGWLTDEELSYMIAVSESTPGPIMVNLATYVGSNQAGFWGAALSTAGVVLPSFLIILLIASVITGLMKYAGVQAFLSGVRPCVVGLILATGLTVALQTLLSVKTLGDALLALAAEVRRRLAVVQELHGVAVVPHGLVVLRLGHRLTGLVDLARGLEVKRLAAQLLRRAEVLDQFSVRIGRLLLRGLRFRNRLGGLLLICGSRSGLLGLRRFSRGLFRGGLRFSRGSRLRLLCWLLRHFFLKILQKIIQVILRKGQTGGDSKRRHHAQGEVVPHVCHFDRLLFQLIGHYTLSFLTVQGLQGRECVQREAA